MSDARMRPRLSGLLAWMILCSGGSWMQAQSSESQELEQLRNKVQQLELEMQALKSQISTSQEQGQPPSKAYGPANFPDDTKEPKPTEPKSSIDLYGYVMLDSGYEFGQSDPNWFDVVRPTKLASKKDEFAPDGKVFFGVRQTRFGVKSSTPTGLGDLKTQFEFELFGTGVDAGQTTFRLRHAWGELGQIGAGQYWSPFMDIDVFPNSIEYWGPNGMVFFRNVQVRWTPIKNDHLRLLFAAERPGASADGGVYADRLELERNVRSNFDLPDFSWQVRATRSWGYLQLAGIFRKISWVDTTPNPQFKIGRDVLGWGVNVSSNVKLTSKSIGKFQVVYGEGIENYMNDAPVDVSVKTTNNPSSPLKGVPLPVLGIVAFVDHSWSERFSSSAGYSIVNIENSNGQNSNDFHQGHYVLANLLFHPIPRVTMGGEFQWGRRVDFSDGFNANDYRIQASFKYDWQKIFQF